MSRHATLLVIAFSAGSSSAIQLSAAALQRRTLSPPLATACRVALPAMQESTAAEAAPTAVAVEDPLVVRLRQRLWNVGWLSWWTQTILSVVSAVLLLFANSVMQRPSPALVGGLLMAFGGLASAFFSLFWTWGYTRISVRLGRKPVDAAEAAGRAAGALRKGLLLNLLGMGASLVGAEAIIGTLAAKALTQSATVAVGAVSAPVQALDLLIVQANTNTLAAHFAGLCASLRLLRATRACEAGEL